MLNSCWYPILSNRLGETISKPHQNVIPNIYNTESPLFICLFFCNSLLIVKKIMCPVLKEESVLTINSGKEIMQI